MIDQELNVTPPLAQGRDSHVEHVQAIVQILTKFPGGDGIEKIPVGGRDDAHVDWRVRRRASDRLKLAGLEKSQEKGLHPQTHFADFVEKHGAAMRLAEQTRLVAKRTGEAAARVAEELGLEQ